MAENNIAALECRFVLRALARKSAAYAGLVVLVSFRASLAGNEIIVGHHFRSEVVAECAAACKCRFVSRVLARSSAAYAGFVVNGCSGACRFVFKELRVNGFRSEAVAENNVAALECRFILRALARKSAACAGSVVLVSFRACLSGNEIIVVHHFRSEVVAERCGIRNNR